MVSAKKDHKSISHPIRGLTGVDSHSNACEDNFNAQSSVGISFDERSNFHFGTDDHPERPDRLVATLARLREEKIMNKVKRAISREATDEELSRCHDSAYISYVDNLKDQFAPPEKDSFVVTKKIPEWVNVNGNRDTYYRVQTGSVARLAAGNAVSLLDEIMDPASTVKRGFALVRPPGHHASKSKAEGFCIYNNVGVAVEHARIKHGLKRVVVLDWDVHHGNGTQDIFFHTPNVHVISLHRHSPKFFPGTGDSKEVGSSAGKGATLNVPLPKGYTDNDVFAAFRSCIIPAIIAIKPSLIVVSAGFDAAENDPLGECQMTPSMFNYLTRQMMVTANLVCEGRLFLVLEGGYDPSSVAECVSNCMNALLDEETQNLTPIDPTLSLLAPPFHILKKTAVDAAALANLVKNGPEVADVPFSDPANIHTVDDCVKALQFAGVSVPQSPFWPLSLTDSALASFRNGGVVHHLHNTAGSDSASCTPSLAPHAHSPVAFMHSEPTSVPNSTIHSPLPSPSLGPLQHAVLATSPLSEDGRFILTPYNALVHPILVSVSRYLSGAPLFLPPPLPPLPKATKLKKKLSSAANSTFNTPVVHPLNLHHHFLPSLPEIPETNCETDHAAVTGTSICQAVSQTSIPAAPRTLLNLARTLSQDVSPQLPLLPSEDILLNAQQDTVKPLTFENSSPLNPNFGAHADAIRVNSFHPEKLIKVSSPQECSFSALLMLLSDPEKVHDPNYEHIIKNHLPSELMNKFGSFEAFTSSPDFRQMRTFAQKHAPHVYAVNFDSNSIVMENSLANLSAPCVADIKIGSGVCPPDATSERKEKLLARNAEHVAANSLGIRIVGSVSTSNSETEFNVQRGTVMTLSQFSSFFRNFSSGSDDIANGRSTSDMRQILRGFNTEIRSLQLWNSKNPGLFLYSSSLLFCFDANPKSDTDDFVKKWRIKVKVIDFAHARMYLPNAVGNSSTKCGESLLYTALKSIEKLLKESIHVAENISTIKPIGNIASESVTISINKSVAASTIVEQNIGALAAGDSNKKNDDRSNIKNDISQNQSSNSRKNLNMPKQSKSIPSQQNLEVTPASMDNLTPINSIKKQSTTSTKTERTTSLKASSRAAHTLSSSASSRVADDEDGEQWVVVGGKSGSTNSSSGINNSTGIVNKNNNKQQQKNTQNKNTEYKNQASRLSFTHTKDNNHTTTTFSLPSVTLAEDTTSLTIKENGQTDGNNKKKDKKKNYKENISNDLRNQQNTNLDIDVQRKNNTKTVSSTHNDNQLTKDANNNNNRKSRATNTSDAKDKSKNFQDEADNLKKQESNNNKNMAITNKNTYKKINKNPSETNMTSDIETKPASHSTNSTALEPNKTENSTPSLFKDGNRSRRNNNNKNKNTDNNIHRMIENVDSIISTSNINKSDVNIDNKNVSNEKQSRNHRNRQKIVSKDSITEVKN